MTAPIPEVQPMGLIVAGRLVMDGPPGVTPCGFVPEAGQSITDGDYVRVTLRDPEVPSVSKDG